MASRLLYFNKAQPFVIRDWRRQRYDGDKVSLSVYVHLCPFMSSNVLQCPFMSTYVQIYELFVAGGALFMFGLTGIFLLTSVFFSIKWNNLLLNFSMLLTVVSPPVVIMKFLNSFSLSCRFSAVRSFAGATEIAASHHSLSSKKIFKSKSERGRISSAPQTRERALRGSVLLPPSILFFF